MPERSEQPTARRLRRAREQGDSPFSAALLQGAAFIGAVVAAPAALKAVAFVAAVELRAAMTSPPRVSALQLPTQLLALTLPLLIVPAVIAALVGAAQTGGVVSVRRPLLDFARLNPLRRLAGVVTAERLLATARALIAAAVVVWASYRVLIAHAASLAAATGDVAASLSIGVATAEDVLWVGALTGLVLGAADWAATRHAWLQRLRMTRADVRREQRESEGDSDLKGARLRTQREALQYDALTALEDATVLIVNGSRSAIALRYSDEDDAVPRVVARGEGDSARRLLDAAHRHRVPVVHDPALTRALPEVAVGDEIPTRLYAPVAEVLRDIGVRASTSGQ